MTSGGSGACRSRGRREAMPNPVSRVSPSGQFTRILAGLMSLWTRPCRCASPSAAAMPIARRRKRPASIGAPTQPLKRFAARILEQQRRTTALADKCERTCRPCGVEFVPQVIFMSEAIERSRQRALRDGRHGQYRVAAAISIRAPSAAEDVFAVPPRDIMITNPIGLVLKRRIQLPDSALGKTFDVSATLRAAAS